MLLAQSTKILDRTCHFLKYLGESMKLFEENVIVRGRGVLPVIGTTIN